MDSDVTSSDRAWPVAAEVHAGPLPESQCDNAPNLGTVRRSAMLFAPCAFLGVAGELDASYMMVVALLGSAQSREEAFSPVGACTVHRIC